MNAFGDWITWLDDNSPVESPPLQLNQLLQQSQAPNLLQIASGFVFLIGRIGRGFRACVNKLILVFQIAYAF